MPIITALLIWLGLAVFFIFLVRLTEHTYNICVFAFSLGKFILDLKTSHASLINLSKVETLRSVVLQGRRRSNPIPDSKYPQCFFSEHTSHHINHNRYPPWLAVELYRYYGFFALGACGCLLFTEVAK